MHWADEAVDRMVAPELAARVRQLVDELPTAQRQVVTLRDVEGLPSPDVEAHLAECEGCAEHLRQIRITVTVTGRIRDEDLDPAAREDLMDLYRRWRRDRGIKEP